MTKSIETCIINHRKKYQHKQVYSDNHIVFGCGPNERASKKFIWMKKISLFFVISRFRHKKTWKVPRKNVAETKLRYKYYLNRSGRKNNWYQLNTEKGIEIVAKKKTLCVTVCRSSRMWSQIPGENCVCFFIKFQWTSRLVGMQNNYTNNHNQQANK